MNLPHRFPFRWIDSAEAGRGRALLTANSTWLRGEAAIPAAFFAELVAQAAAVLLADPAADPATGSEGAQQRWLAGIDRLEMHRAVHAGDLLEISVTPGRRFGNALRVEGVVSCAGEAVADVVLLLV